MLLASNFVNFYLNQCLRSKYFESVYASLQSCKQNGTDAIRTDVLRIYWIFIVSHLFLIKPKKINRVTARHLTMQTYVLNGEER